MNRMMTQPKAMAAMGANRVAEQRERQMAEMVDLCRHSAQRILELTEMVADLRERVAKLEGEGHGEAEA